mmetsp:Transcript_85963/g.270990  ORF Transcript_85963/g.270990 Transcript_85963/m.270990 type:complete len:500 (+) Transcript_85963:36-1535(+)
MGGRGVKRKGLSLAGWDPSAKDTQVEVEFDALTGGHYKVSCASTGRAWIGLRGRPGVVCGAYCFEVKVSEGLLRVGWSSSTASFSLGTDGEGFGFGGTGKKSHLSKFVDYGAPFEAGDVVTCCIDRGSREISFGVNGRYFGKAFTIPRKWDGVALFPALCAREAFKATGYFGCPEHPKVPYGCDFWPLGDAYESDVVESDAGPPTAETTLPALEEAPERKQDRAERFTKMARIDQDLTKLSTYVPDPSSAAKPGGALVGLSRSLERGYLRDGAKLQDPMHIRPVPVLREALAHALQARRPWAWEAEMLRAIRQDLTVQHADASFMEEVCEVSSLRALENSDWSTFAVCSPGVCSRPVAAELSWLMLLGSSAISRSNGLRHCSEPRGATAEFVRAVLADMSVGHWTRALRRKPPTEVAERAYGLVVRPLALAKVLAVATKAFPRIRQDTLRSMGPQVLPAGMEATEGVIDGRLMHPKALQHVEAAKRPTRRDDHSQEFLR